MARKRADDLDDADEPQAIDEPEAVVDDGPAPVANADPPSQAELDADKEPLSAEEAELLLRAGHRLRKKDDDPANWITINRHAGDIAIAFNATPAALAEILSQPLLLAE